MLLQTRKINCYLIAIRQRDSMLDWLGGRLLRSKDELCNFVYNCLEGGCSREADVDSVSGLLLDNEVVQCICKSVQDARPSLYATVKDDMDGKKRVVSVSNSNQAESCSLVGTFKVWRRHSGGENRVFCIDYSAVSSRLSCDTCKKLIKSG